MGNNMKAIQVDGEGLVWADYAAPRMWTGRNSHSGKSHGN